MRTNQIRADHYWNDTGIDLVANRRYRATVVPGTGEPLKDASFLATSINGEDWKSVPHATAEFLHLKRKDDALWFALIGTIAQGEGWILRDGEPFVAPATGRLVCYFNDVALERFYRDNAGWVVLDVEPLAGARVSWCGADTVSPVPSGPRGDVPARAAPPGHLALDQIAAAGLATK